MDYREKDMERELFKRSGIPFKKSKEEVWKDLVLKLEEKGEEKNISHPVIYRRMFIGIAASAAVILALVSFLRFHSISITCPAGEHISISLPDGSTVDLNASSELSYHPNWWKFSRELKFEGEGFFNVLPGGSFRVVSNYGVTEVIGTSFNIFSRFDKYSVTCMTGKIKVRSSQSRIEATLLPLEKATLIENGNFEIKLIGDEKSVSAWKNNFLTFRSVHLCEVLEEVERQFDVEISAKDCEDHIYTGNFSFSTDVESVLNLICRPLDLENLKTADAEYIITSQSEK